MLGTITGQSSFSQLTYKGRTFKVGQWDISAMSTLEEFAFLKARQWMMKLPGDLKTIYRRDAELGRMAANGDFSFDALQYDGILYKSKEALAVFLHSLMAKIDNDVTQEMVLQIVNENMDQALEAVNNANPLMGKAMANGKPEAKPSPSQETTSQGEAITSETQQPKENT